MNQYLNNQNGKVNTVFVISTILVTVVVLWGALYPDSLNHASNIALDWMITNFGWFYMLITAFFILFIIVLAFSPFGKLRLGKREDRPEFSWFSWISMLFAAGIGVGFVFWGVAEPVLYYLDPPVGYEPETIESASAGILYGSYHWALHPWAIFALTGMVLAYVQYRKGLPALISSAFYPVFGERMKGWFGKTIDILAVLATCTGVATTFGLSAMQISGGLSYISSIPNSAWTQLIIIIIVTILFLISTARGVNKGIKIFSNINLVVAGVFLLFIIIVGPTLFIAENFVATLGSYITNVVPMSLGLTPFTDSDWLGENTIFFWAWHISWAPFMGLFIARISRGRTIREFIAGTMIIPSLIAIIWFTAFGGTALHIELFGADGLSALVQSDVELALFAMLAELPWSLVTNIIAIILITIFFITSSDSAAFVLGSMTFKGVLEPKLSVKLIWGLLIAGAASVLLFSGGGGLVALRTASIIAALPFAMIMILMIVCILIIFRRDFKADKQVKKEQELNELKEKLQADMKNQVSEEVKLEMHDTYKEKIYEELKSELMEELKRK